MKIGKIWILILILFILIVQASAVSFGAEDPYSQVSQEEIGAAMIQLSAMEVPTTNSRGQALNYKTFVVYKVIAYGTSFGDMKIDDDDVMQYRYLGYDYQGNPITNDLFPPDETGATPLTDKIWVTNPLNYSSWEVAFQHSGLKNYMLETKVLNDGQATNLSLTAILAKRPVVDWSEKLDYMKVMSTPSVEVNGTVQLRQSNGYYDTFTIPAMKNTIKTQVLMSTPYNQYTINASEEYIEIPVTITASINYGTLPASYMKAVKVKYKGYTAPAGSNAEKAESGKASEVFPIKVYKKDLLTGNNNVLLDGAGEFKSIFANDPDPIVKTASKTISVFLGEAVDAPPEPLPTEEPGQTEISAEADLVLPPFTYEGHPTPAEDCSLFQVDGTSYSAEKAYENDLARNRFSVVERSMATISKIRPTLAEFIFPFPGEYTGRLEVYPDGGLTQADQETIEVRNTPEVLAELGGVQKENRRQLLTIEVAVNPAFPLREFYVELQQMETEGGTEAVAGTKIMLTEEDPQRNSRIIKTRSMIKEDSMGEPRYFEKYSLEFLTKDPEALDAAEKGEPLSQTNEPEYFQYRIFAEDSRGHTDLEVKNFTVAPDLTPKASIQIDPQYMREAASNTAMIEVEDGTVALDGDQLVRSWEFIDPGANGANGLIDLSFGTKKKVRYSKEGVGPFEVRLSVKERWIEPTLDEYVTDEDRKKAAATAGSEVINIAPVVSLSPLASIKAQILIMASGNQDFERLNAKSIFQQEFVRNGIDADLIVEKLEMPILSLEEQQKAAKASGRSYVPLPAKVFAVDSPFGYEGCWTFLEQDAYAIDNSRLYIIEAGWPAVDSGDYPVSPYKINAYGIKGSYEALTAGHSQLPLKDWVCTIDPTVFKIMPTSKVKMEQDDQGNYLYLVCDGKTLLIDKKTGVALASLNFECGPTNYNSERYIYSLNGSGLYSLDKYSGSIKRVYSAPASGSLSSLSRRINGRVHFLMTSGTNLFRVTFDPDTEEIMQTKLTGTAGDSAATTYKLIDIDAGGSMIIKLESGKGQSWLLGTRVYSNGNKLLLNNSRTEQQSGQYLQTPVTDENGNCTHIAFSRTRKSSGDYYFEVDLMGISDGFTSSYSYRSGSKYLSKNENIFAGKIGSKIYLSYGAIWDYIYNSGYNYGERASLLVADIQAKTMILDNVGNIGIQASDEFGKRAGIYAAVQSSGNSNTSPNSRAKVISWPQSPWQQIGRSIEKYLQDGDGLKYVVVADEEGKLSDGLTEVSGGSNGPGAGYENLSLAEMVRRKAEDVCAEFIYLEDPDPVALRDRIIEERMASGEVLAIEAPVSGAVLSKNFELKSDTVYYYDYDVKMPPLISEGQQTGADKLAADFLKTDYRIAHVLTDDHFEGEGFQVLDIEKEDFDDPSCNPFFTIAKASKISENVYNACDAGIGSSSSNSMHILKDSISLNVPAGKKAILSFDYSYVIDPQFIKENGILINGEPWDINIFGQSSGSGQYIHRSVLNEGQTKLDFSIAFYGRLPASYKMSIDNLRVLFVEKADSEADWDRWQNDSGQSAPLVEQYNNGWSHITGSFKTPPETIGFRAQNMQILNEDFNDGNLIPYLKDSAPGGTSSFFISGGQYTHTTGKSCNGALTFSIPSGMTGMAKVDTWSSISRSSVSYAMGTQSWTNGLASVSQSAYRFMGSPYTIALPVLNGSNTLAVQNDFKDRTGITALQLKIFENNSISAANRYLFDLEEHKIFLENDKFNGDCSVKFSFPDTSGSAGKDTSTFSLQNLKIYSMENGTKNYIADDYFSTGSGTCGWEATEAEMDIRQDTAAAGEEPIKMVYKKGELISYNINYYDYENDPSKKQFWRYKHQPFNDGLHPDNLKILDKPIERFYLDGKYEVEHWQEDSTGNVNYDKLSNVERMTFYIEGGGEAPWITSIRTLPATVRAGGSYQLQIGVDDREKDDLALRSEIYDANGKMILCCENDPIKAVNGKYPLALTIPATAGGSGKYRIVCTVSDATGTGVGSSSFIVVSDGKVAGAVQHTEQWDLNRRKYNLSKFGVEENAASVNYGLRPRGKMVFWSGEKFVLRAKTEGYPASISAEILGESGVKTELRKDSLNGGSASMADGSAWTESWSGELWDDSFINRWGRKEPQELTVRFTAIFRQETGEGASSENIVKTTDVKIIMDSPEDFWQLHRVW